MKNKLIALGLGAVLMCSYIPQLSVAAEGVEEETAVWSEFVENEFSGEAQDFSIAWKLTSNTNDRKGASYTVDTDNKLLTITSDDGAAAGDVLYGVSATIKNVLPNNTYTITFKEKSNLTSRENNGVYLNCDTFAMTYDNKDPYVLSNVSTPKNSRIDIETDIVDHNDWVEREYTYTTGSGMPGGCDTYAVRFMFMFRGVTGATQIKDLQISGSTTIPTEAPTAPLKNDETDYTPAVHTGNVIDPLNTDEVFQYHFAGGTDEYMATGTDERTKDNGKKYDAYLWVPNTVTKSTLRGLVAIKTNLIEVPLAYSRELKDMLSTKKFGILFIIDKNDLLPEDYSGDGKNYKNILQGMYTRKDYKGDDLFTMSKWQTYDGKDAADIMNDIMSGIADVSGFECIRENTPVITIGHSAASPFGYRSGNWAYDRVIAQIDMKNGMWGDASDSSTAEDDAHGFGMVPGIPSMQYAAQYTEHSVGIGRDRSVRDARYHIDHQRAIDTNQLVSHIIEWGSGHYDLSPNAISMMTAYIEKAIDYRLPDSFNGGNDEYTLNDLTDTGYLMKPFEKNSDGSEREAGYYKENMWLSSGQENAAASEEDKKESFWYFDKEFADKVNNFTGYAVPEAPDAQTTKVSGKIYSEYEPYMLIKNPAVSVYADSIYDFNSFISPYTSFGGNMSRYGSNRFVNYEKMESPSAGNGDTYPSVGTTNTADLRGYDTVTADTYYLNTIPYVMTPAGAAYDGAGEEAVVPADTKAEIVPLIAPYELIESVLIDTTDMVRDGSAVAESVAAVTRNTLRFHNNRVYHNTGCAYTNGTGQALDSFAMIMSPEVKNGDNVTSSFKSTGIQMNVPFVSTGKGTDQTLTITQPQDVSVNGVNENPKFDVSYVSSDSDLQKYTDVFVNYGPAKAVRTVDPEDGSYSWQIEILLDEIPKDVQFPIEVEIVASNLGKWEKVSGAAATAKFNITNTEVDQPADIASLINNGSIKLIDSTPNRKEAETIKQTLYLFDKDEMNCSDYRTSEGGWGSYIIFDMGAKNEFRLSGVRILARQTNNLFGRLAGAVIQGANVYDPENPNAGWTNLTSATEASEVWQELNVLNSSGYRYIRLYNKNQWFGNAAELELYGEYGEMESTTEKKEELRSVLEAIGGSENALYKKIAEISSAYIEDESVRLEQINTLLQIYEYAKKSFEWIENDINPWFLERLNNELVENDFSIGAKADYISEMSGFYAKGSELSGDIIRDMGPEFVMSDSEKDMILADRIADAVARAKAQIDKYPSENYIMLKELISYVTRGDNEKYCDTPNKYGMDAATCEYVITNINYTLKNLDGNAVYGKKVEYKSGTTWIDKYGSKISAGGGQIIEGGDGKYYWYGEDNKVAYALRTGVACYSTYDFSEWTYEGLVFNAFTDEIEANKMFADDFLTDSILDNQGRIERPKVLYNEKNDTYVMWMHLERNGNYNLSSAGVAVSTSGPTGPFEWKWFGRPVYDEEVTYNADLCPAYRDMTLFKDDDGTAYVLFSSEANRVPYMAKLNDDFTWIDTEGMNTVSKEDFESGKAEYVNGMYYTGKMYKYNSDGTGYVDENGNPVEVTEEMLKTLTYLDTSTNGEPRIDKNQGYRFPQSAKHNYYLPSYNRYQLAYGDTILIREGTTVDRADGLSKIPTVASGEFADYGRWVKIGQYEDGCSTYREAPAIIKHNGYYYMIASGISGWKANTGVYLRTDDLFGKWETVTNPFCGQGQTDYTTSFSYNNNMWDSGWMPDSSKSFLSQSTCMFEYKGTVYYMGDRWKDGDYWDPNHLGVKKSTYVWAPVTFAENGGGAENLEIYWTDEIVFPERKMLSIVSAEKSGTAINYQINVDTVNDEAVLAVALYNEDGILEGVRYGETSGSFDVDQNDLYTIKAMLWTKNNTPLAEAETKEIS